MGHRTWSMVGLLGSVALAGFFGLLIANELTGNCCAPVQQRVDQFRHAYEQGMDTTMVLAKRCRGGDHGACDAVLTALRAQRKVAKILRRDA